jgi:histidyl-tRNA synthetase
VSIEVAQQLRQQGISVDFDQLRRGIGKSLKYAAAKQAQQVIIIGPKELENNSVTLRDMKTGKQEIVALSEIRQRFKKPTE